MKTLLLLFSLIAFADNPKENISIDIEKISRVVSQFSQSADQRNLQKMEEVLHPEFRSVVNRLFGSEEVSVMDRSIYLNLLKEEKIGGDKREVAIQSVNIQGNTAIVKAILLGKSLRFDTYLQLIKDVNGKWWIVSDMPSISKL